MLAALALATVFQCGAPAPVGAPVVGCAAGVIPGFGSGHLESYHCPQTQELVLWAYTPVPSMGFLFGGQVHGSHNPPFSAGTVCMGLPVWRFAFQPFHGSVNGWPTHLPLQWFTPGETWYFQGWWYELCDNASAFTDARRVVIP